MPMWKGYDVAKAGRKGGREEGGEEGTHPSATGPSLPRALWLLVVSILIDSVTYR